MLFLADNFKVPLTIIAWDYIAEQQWILLNGKYHFTRGCMLLFPFLITQVLNEAYNIGVFCLKILIPSVSLFGKTLQQW